MKKWIRPAILLFALILLLVGGRTLLASTKSTNNSSSKVTIAPPKQTIDLDREFTFPIRGVDNEEVGRVIKYSIKKMEIADEIIVKGQRATAVAGRTFLLLTIKLTNNEDVGIEIDSRDYIRLTLDGSEESLAADIHNDPVEVQPLSTKFTRIGFPVDDSIKSIQMSVGEIKGDKDLIQVDL